jgi:4-amino-4-deoxy-L-arabinose transferase-like glycosyltransferase
MIVIVLLASLLVRIWYTIQPIIVVWDAAIYISIGKYIFSGGTLGLFELFRPVALPLILGCMWKIGLNPLIWGTVLQILSSLGVVYLVYLIGEKIEKSAGLYASVLTSFTAIFIAFSNAPLSDIPSVFCTTLALFLFSNKKYYVSGLAVGLAFLFRFPQALMLIALGLSILAIHEYSLKVKIRKIIWIGCGFATLSIPYFIVNTILYKNPFLPIIVGNQIVATTALLPHSYSFYIIGFLIQNPFLIFACAALIVYVVDSFKKQRACITPVFISGVIFLGYFSYNLHQELRYGIAFLPFIAILAGYGLTFSLQDLRGRYKTHLVVFVISLFLILICIKAYDRYSYKFILTPEQVSYYSYFKDKGPVSLITSSPPFIVYSDLTIAEVTDTWERGINAYNNDASLSDYFAYDTCEVSENNPTTGPQAKQQLEQALTHDELVFSQEARGCSFRIYKLHH